MRPKIFISHSHQDKKIVEKLIELIRGCISIHSSQIVCSSVIGYKLPYGEPLSSSIKNVLKDCSVVIGVISPNSLRSNYVNFELGVGWYLEKAIAVIDPRINYANIPGPLKEHNGLMINNEDDVSALIDFIILKTGLEPERIAMINNKINLFSKQQTTIENSFKNKRVMDLSVIGSSEDILYEATQKVKAAKSIIRLTSFGKTNKQIQPSFFIESFNSTLKNSLKSHYPIEVRVAHGKCSDISKKRNSYAHEIRELFKYRLVDVNSVIFDVLIVDNNFAQIAFPELAVDKHFRTSINISDTEFINELINWYDNYLWDGKTL